MFNIIGIILAIGCAGWAVSSPERLFEFVAGSVILMALGAR